MDSPSDEAKKASEALRRRRDAIGERVDAEAAGDWSVIANAEEALGRLGPLLVDAEAMVVQAETLLANVQERLQGAEPVLQDAAPLTETAEPMLERGGDDAGAEGRGDVSGGP